MLNVSTPHHCMKEEFVLWAVWQILRIFDTLDTQLLLTYTMISTSFVDLLCFCSVFCLLCLCTRLLICALWSPAGKGLTSWLSFVVSNCEFVTFPWVFWVRCGTWLHRFLIFAPLLTLTLTLDFKVISIFWDFCCNLYRICTYCS